SNVILSNCKFEDTFHVLLFKMRPDTPQKYMNVLVDRARGRVRNGVEVQTWRQFFNKTDRDDMPKSLVENVTVKNVTLDCTREFYRDRKTADYTLRNFTFENISVTDPSDTFDTSNIQKCKIINVEVNGVPVE
ncbi:MAG: exopolygalacturonase, partial [Duncaniella sp.]|nr:exopolygalacturonase [Duncaniella sp.]